MPNEATATAQPQGYATRSVPPAVELSTELESTRGARTHWDASVRGAGLGL